MRFATAYGTKFTSIHTTPEILEIWYREWMEALAGIDKELVVQAFNECKAQSEWPPSMAEIIKKCDQKLGLPNIHDAIQLAISQKFDHPIVKELYDRLGSWSLKNDTEKAILSKAKLYYPEILSEFRLKRQMKALGLKQIGDKSHGSEISGDNTRGIGVRKAEGYLF